MLWDFILSICPEVRYPKAAVLWGKGKVQVLDEAVHQGDQFTQDRDQTDLCGFTVGAQALDESSVVAKLRVRENASLSKKPHQGFFGARRKRISRGNTVHKRKRREQRKNAHRDDLKTA